MIKETSSTPVAVPTAGRTLECATIRLHELMRDGHGDSDLADGTRDEMYEAWQALPSDTRALLDGLSGDLYMLTDEERANSETAPDALRSFQRAHEARQWEEALHLLRDPVVMGVYPEAVRAYFRGLAWAGLGYHDAAYCFFDHASKLDCSNDNYTFFALDALSNAGRLDEARHQANAIAGNASASFLLLFKAAEVLGRIAHVEGPEAYQRTLDVIDRALGRPRAETERPPFLLPNAYFIRGYCHEELGQRSEAIAAYASALSIDPDNDAALTAHGLAIYDTDRAAALRDFERAVATGTPLEWPFVYLAHDALRKSDFNACVNFAQEAIARTDDPNLVANLIEWKAIARAQQGQPGEAIELLREASALSPFNHRIAQSLRDLLKGKAISPERSVNDTSLSKARAQLQASRRAA